jgi:amino acid transporter
MIPPLSGPHWAGIGAASLLAFFAFIGFEDMVNVAEEVKDPRHTLPRAIAITLVVATLLYVAVATAVLFAVPVEELAGSQAPLMLVFRDEPPVFQMGFAAVATVATVNGVLIQIVMASRVVYGMADRGQLPAVLARVSPVTHTPSSATMLVVGTIFVLSSFFPIGDLAGGTSQIVLSVFVLVNLSLAALKLRNMAPGDAFVVPVIVPILGAASSIALLVTPLL